MYDATGENVCFERKAEIDISVKVNGSFCRNTYTVTPLSK